jgi:hypothetical protein
MGRQFFTLQALLSIATLSILTSCAEIPPKPHQILHQVCDEHKTFVVGSTGRVYRSHPSLCQNNLDSKCRQYLSTVTTKPESQMSQQELNTVRQNVASHCGNAYVACMLIMSGKLSCEDAKREFPW